ncbi:MAG: hypothetical protein Q7S00_02315 [bacterium]|nr:hypothetical protein [bacterium]
MRSYLAIFVCLLLGACAAPQVSELTQFQFKKTAFCTTQDDEIVLTNNASSNLHIVGIAIEPGSDPYGHFKITGFQVGSAPALNPIAGRVEDVTIPPGYPYTILTRFSPRSEASSNQALISIAIDGAKEGVLQIILKGEVEEGTSCPEFSQSEAAVDYDGEMTLRIDRVVGLAQKIIDDPMTTDEDQIVRPYEPALLTVRFDLNNKKIIFPQITDDDFFILPPSLNEHVNTLFPGDVILTSESEIVGMYDPATGQIDLPDLAIRMREVNGAFNSIMRIFLTTKTVDLPIIFPQSQLIKAGMQVANGGLSGQNLNPRGDSELAGRVIFVGIAKFDSVVTGTSLTLKTSLPNTKMAVQIEGTVLEE